MPPPPTRPLGPEPGFPLSNITVAISNRDPAIAQAVQTTHATLQQNNFSPPQSVLPQLVVTLNGDRVIALWSVPAAVYINRASRNLLDFSAVERQLRSDTILRLPLAPSSWASFFYHPQTRQALWEYATADEEYTVPCGPCQTGPSNSPIQHCTPVRRPGGQTRVVCARCVWSQHPNQCYWPSLGDTAPTPRPSPGGAGRAQRSIASLPRAQSPRTSLTSPGSGSPAPSSSPRANPPPVTPLPSTPPSRVRSDTPLSDQLSAMSISPVPGGDRALLWREVSNSNTEYYDILKLRGRADFQARASAYNTNRHALLIRVIPAGTTLAQALTPYIPEGNPPRIRPINLSSEPSSSRPPTNPSAYAPIPSTSGGHGIPRPAVSRMSSPLSPPPPRDQRIPRVSGTGSLRVSSSIGDYFRPSDSTTPPPSTTPASDPAPHVVTHPSVDRSTIVAADRVTVPANASPLMRTLWTLFLQAIPPDDPSTRTLPTSHFNWDRMRRPIVINQMGRFERVDWRQLTQDGQAVIGWVEVVTFEWRDAEQRWVIMGTERIRASEIEQRFLYERGG
ncbi:hypothetical protein H2198_008915 [Neophaeococcomyces mojaviensis]|uniref:Uncharacterized protein n=1 Tax=Neophaeococcomyces mojaviensis TaxID=3383035 RepID=A0ACC2ZVZ7_9EURO|nr:hypothetical protein H2198_008915 [Knufia sp. JES_112]